MSETATHLSVQLRHQLGALSLDVSFALTTPWTVLFGPSGSGKTTILRAIAGLLHPASARIASFAYDADEAEHGLKSSENDTILNENSALLVTKNAALSDKKVTLNDSAEGIFVPAHKRMVRMAAQQPGLFPHLTVRQNIAYGARNGSRAASDRASRANYIDEAMERFRLGHVAGKFPGQLSGGERQRVNLARAATAPGCRILLLDEPFSGLDLALRDELIANLRAWLAYKGSPVLSVTHDISEVFMTGDEVITLEDGRVAAQGPPEIVLAAQRAQLLRQLKAQG